MVTITIEQIESQPRTFVEQLTTGEDIIITNGITLLARVSSIPSPARKTLYGSLADKMWIADDFDLPLEGFEGD